MKKLKVKPIEIETGKPIVVLSREDAMDLSVHMADRLRVRKGKKEATVIVDISEKMLKPGEMGVFEEVKAELKLKKGDTLEVRVAEPPVSVEYIKKKLNGAKLNEREIHTIIKDIVEDNLSDVELSSFVAASYINKYDMDETVAMTNAMIKTGQTINFGDHVVDKHCIGGVAGNRTTMLVVPIVTAAGLTMPKTSSRAITSPSGTADTMEVLAKVDFSVSRIKKIVKEVGGCIVWSGSMDLAPADDKIIKVRYPLSLDPEGQLLASIMAKKKSIGSDYVVIDIPVGAGAKIATRDKGEALAHKFIQLGDRIGIDVDCLVTDGSEPIGRGIGPALECRDVLACLEGKGPQDLSQKACELAGRLFEMIGENGKGKGKEKAEKLLKSGKARDKMYEIIGAQEGDIEVTSENIKVGKETADVIATGGGTVKEINNKDVSRVARVTGAPKDNGAGMELHVNVGTRIKKGDKLFTLHAESKSKLKEALSFAKRRAPVKVGGVILEVLE